jgi:membrane associated rhomboid family serine protease
MMLGQSRYLASMLLSGAVAVVNDCTLSVIDSIEIFAVIDYI